MGGLGSRVGLLLRSRSGRNKVWGADSFPAQAELDGGTTFFGLFLSVV